MKKKKFPALQHAFKSLWWRFKIKFLELPLVGDIDGEYTVPEARVKSRVFGKSQGLPVTVEIKVKDADSIPENVGRIVKKKLFSSDDYAGKDFIFNVCFSCGKSGLLTKGVYTDPKSHWFNVFFGYYEIDVPKNTWQRPFGYDIDRGKSSVNFSDLARIGTADWNYFSNYLYGVPNGAIEGCSDPDDPGIIKRTIGRVEIRKRSWDHVEVDNFRVVSAYTAPGEEHSLEERSVFTPMWRLSYGRPHPRKGFGDSFFPCRMKAHFYMAYDSKFDDDLKEEAYRTFIFGGTVNHDAAIDDKKFKGRFRDRDSFNDAFLEEQMKAARTVIEKNFAHLGFRDN
ncbi:MAG TPA: hypothetical protein P5346_05010 [Spirochaetota bacterium]|nr:hypothetical protein [Spirochaetota bacterium]